MKKVAVLTFCILLIFSISVHAQGHFATVLKKTGGVSVRPSGTIEFSVPATLSMGLSKGDALKTDETGYAAIVFSDDKSLLKIRKNSQIEIKEQFSVRTIRISQGRLLAQITPGLLTSYRIETPTSVASVKGTNFWTITSPQFGDRFYGIKGLVEILNLISGIEITLEPGQMVISTPDGQLLSIPIDPEDFPEDVEEELEPEPEVPVEEEEIETAYEPKEGEIVSPPMVTEGVAPEAPVEEAPKPSKKPYGMGLGLGSVTIDGVIYNQIALRPEVRFGKLGVGLDIVLYMDDKGKIRKNEWDEFSDYLDKIYYLRWAQQGDPFFAKVGALDNVTLGYGILINGYFNTTEYPQVRKVGLHTGMQFNKLGWEAFMANAKEVTGPGLLAGRVTYRLSEKFPLTLGGTLVMDGNQYKGLKDTDDDYVPDAFDAFPDEEFELPDYYYPGAFSHNPGDELKGKKYNKDSDGDGIPDQLDYDIDGDGLTDNFVPDTSKNFDDFIQRDPNPFSTEDKRKTLTAASFDIGYPALNLKFFKIFVYGQAATFISGKLTDYNINKKFTPGWGIAAPGLRMNIFDISNLTLEYRYAGENFLYSFWDRAYDFERVAIRTKADGSLWPYTKDEMKLMRESMKGIFGSVDVNILNYAILGSSYQHMTTGSEEVKSFSAFATVPKGKIPKLAEATAFYQRNNDENPFDFGNPSENTIWGYRLGFEIGGSVVISYVFQTTYRDLNGDGNIDPETESIILNTVETGFSF